MISHDYVWCEFFLNLKFSNSTIFGNIQHIQYDRGHKQEAHTFTDTFTLGSQMNATDCSILRLYKILGILKKHDTECWTPVKTVIMEIVCMLFIIKVIYKQHKKTAFDVFFVELINKSLERTAINQIKP